MLVPADRVVQVSISASQLHGADPDDLATFRPQRHLDNDETMTLLPFGGGERVCLGKALAELEIRLLAVGLLKQLTLELEPVQDLSLSIIPNPRPRTACWCIQATKPRHPDPICSLRPCV